VPKDSRLPNLWRLSFALPVAGPEGLPDRRGVPVVSAVVLVANLIDAHNRKKNKTETFAETKKANSLKVSPYMSG
jgi:hypothetical protein